MSYWAKIKNKKNLYVKNTEVENVDSHKLLAVNIDHFLLWNKHADQICKSLISKITLLLKIMKYLPLDTRLLYFNAYIQPLLDYCLTTWWNCSKQDLTRISKLLKRAACIILNKLYDAPSKPFQKIKMGSNGQKRFNIKKLFFLFL